MEGTPFVNEVVSPGQRVKYVGYGIIGAMAKKEKKVPQEQVIQPVDETLPIKRKNEHTALIENEIVDLELTQPTAAPDQTIDELLETMESKAPVPRKGKRCSPWVWVGILGMILIAVIGVGIGYASALKERSQEEKSQRLNVAVAHFELALLDQNAGRLLAARQRYEYVLSIYPEYPGLDEKLVEIGLLIGQDPNIVPPETSAVGTPSAPINVDAAARRQTLNALNRDAKKYLNAQDWNNLYVTAVKMRDINPKYNVTQVDGYYYMALRNLGIEKIKSGNLEVGSYYFSLAEQISPIDNEAQSYNTWAHMYLTAGSWWGISWLNAIEKFGELHQIVPNLMDSSRMTVKARYAGAYEGYGDFLQLTYKWCDAVPQFEIAAGIYPSDRLMQKIEKGQKLCANPPPTPTPTFDPYAPTPTPTKKPKKN